MTLVELALAWAISVIALALAIILGSIALVLTYILLIFTILAGTIQWCLKSKKSKRRSDFSVLLQEPIIDHDISFDRSSMV